MAEQLTQESPYRESPKSLSASIPFNTPQESRPAGAEAVRSVGSGAWLSRGAAHPPPPALGPPARLHFPRAEALLAHTSAQVYTTIRQGADCPKHQIAPLGAGQRSPSGRGAGKSSPVLPTTVFSLHPPESTPNFYTSEIRLKRALKAALKG